MCFLLYGDLGLCGAWRGKKDGSLLLLAQKEKKSPPLSLLTIFFSKINEK